MHFLIIFYALTTLFLLIPSNKITKNKIKTIREQELTPYTSKYINIKIPISETPIIIKKEHLTNLHEDNNHIKKQKTISTNKNQLKNHFEKFFSNSHASIQKTHKQCFFINSIFLNKIKHKYKNTLIKKTY
jgi:hypothetical protein